MLLGFSPQPGPLISHLPFRGPHLSPLSTQSLHHVTHPSSRAGRGSPSCNGCPRQWGWLCLERPPSTARERRGGGGSIRGSWPPLGAQRKEHVQRPRGEPGCWQVPPTPKSGCRCGEEEPSGHRAVRVRASRAVAGVLPGPGYLETKRKQAQICIMENLSSGPQEGGGRTAGWGAGGEEDRSWGSAEAMGAASGSRGVPVERAVAPAQGARVPVQAELLLGRPARWWRRRAVRQRGKGPDCAGRPARGQRGGLLRPPVLPPAASPPRPQRGQTPSTGGAESPLSDNK